MPYRSPTVSVCVSLGGAILFLLIALPLQVKAETIGEFLDRFKFGAHLLESVQGLSPMDVAVDPPAAISSPRAGAVYKFDNRNATLQAGEPTEGGIVTRSIWAEFTPTANRRMVLHTFGSDVDTVIAVYTGSTVNALNRITGNNNFNIPGASATASLVQFDAVAGTTYSIQIGSMNNAQGDIFLSVFEFDTDGGLSAFLLDRGGNPIFNARDYFCSAAGLCPLAKFIVYNSTTQILSVVPSSTIGTRFTPPATFSLSPGAGAVATFVAATNSDFTTRTQIGEFIFSGRAGGTEESRATHRGIATVRGSVAEATLQAAVLPVTRAGRVGAALTAFATIANTGNTPAVGCFIRTPDFSYQKVTFQETNPATNAPVGAPNTAVNIAAGQSKTFFFAFASQQSQLADVASASDLIVLQCANGQAPSNAANRFAVTTLSSLDLADMISISATTGGTGIVNVPLTGGAFSTATVNIGFPATITARPRYVKPFTDSGSTSFSGLVCETNPSTGACLLAPAATVQFNAATNVAHTFAVFVQRPATDPGFSPGERRMFLQFEQSSPPGFFGQNPIQLPVGATSVATRAQ